MESIPGSRCDRSTAASPPVASASLWIIRPCIPCFFIPSYFHVFLLMISIQQSPQAPPFTCPCSAECSSSSLMWFLNGIGKTADPGLGCPSRRAVLFPHPWAYPVMCMFWYLHGGVYSRYSLVTHHKYSSERKPSCFLLMTHFHSFPSCCWAGTC